MSKLTKIRIAWSAPWLALLILGWGYGIETMWWYWPILAILAIGYVAIGEVGRRQ